VNEGQRIRNFGLGAENTHVVDMVLLGMSSGMDTIWFDFNSIRWHRIVCGADEQWWSHQSEGLHFSNIRVQQQHVGPCTCNASCIRCSVCRCVCLRHQVSQFPTPMNELENLIFVKLYNFYIREREAATKKNSGGGKTQQPK